MADDEAVAFGAGAYAARPMRSLGAERRELCGRKRCGVREGLAREKFWRKERLKIARATLK